MIDGEYYHNNTEWGHRVGFFYLPAGISFTCNQMLPQYTKPMLNLPCHI